MCTLLNEADYMGRLFPHHPGKKLQPGITQHCFGMDEAMMINNIVITKHVVNIDVAAIMIASRNIPGKLKD